MRIGRFTNKKGNTMDQDQGKSVNEARKALAEQLVVFVQFLADAAMEAAERDGNPDRVCTFLLAAREALRAETVAKTKHSATIAYAALVDDVEKASDAMDALEVLEPKPL